jgi:hypothetical protein
LGKHKKKASLSLAWRQKNFCHLKDKCRDLAKKKKEEDKVTAKRKKNNNKNQG